MNETLVDPNGTLPDVDPQDSGKPKPPKVPRMVSDAGEPLTSPLPQDQAASPDDYQQPFPSFIPPLIAAAPLRGTRQQKEQWLKSAEDGLKKYNYEVDVGRLRHYAERGRIADYMQQQFDAASGADDWAKLAKLEQAVPFSDTRSPAADQDFYRALQPFFNSPDEKVASKAVDIFGHRQVLGEFGRIGERAIERVKKSGDSSVKEEAERWISGIMKEAVAGTFFSEAGTPEERVAEAVLNTVNREAEYWKTLRDANPHKERLPDEETMRKYLMDVGFGNMNEQLKKTDISEGTAEWLARKTAGFVGIVPGVGIAKNIIGGGARKLAGKAMAGVAEKIPKIAKVAGVGTEYASLMGWIYSADPSPAQKLALKDLSPEDRKKGEESAKMVNAVLGATMLPVLSFAGPIGKSLTGGKLPSVLKFVEPTVGITVAGQAHHGTFEYLREAAEGIVGDENSEAKKRLDLILLTHPKAKSSLNRLVFGDEKGRWNAAVDLAKELAPNAVFFGAAAAFASVAPAALSRDAKRLAAGEIKDIFKGDPTAQKMATEALDEMARTPEPTAKEKLIEQLGPEEAQAKINEEVRAERMRRQAPAAAREVADKQADTEAETRRHRAGASEEVAAEDAAKRSFKQDEVRLEEPPKGPGKVPVEPEDVAKDPTELAKAAREDAEAIRETADKATGEERVALRDLAAMHEQRAVDIEAGKEPKPMVEGLTDAANAREDLAIQEMQERPALEEQAAKRLLDDGLARQEVQARSDELSKAVNRELASDQEKSGDVPAIPPLSDARAEQVVLKNVQVGDIVETPHGEMVVDSVAKDAVSGVTTDGQPIIRTPRELLKAGVKLVGKKRKVSESKPKSSGEEAASGHPEATKAETAAEREVRIQRHAQRIAMAERGGKQSKKERAEARRKLAEEIARDDERAANEDAQARIEQGSKIDAPPPGEDRVPPEMLAAVATAKEASDSGLLGKLAESKNWQKIDPESFVGQRARSVLETAKRREFYYKGLKGEAKAAQALYDHLRDQEGLGYAAEPITGTAKRLARDLELAFQKEGPDFSVALQTVIERHHDFIKGPWAAAMRLIPEGIAALNRLELGIAKVSTELRKSLGSESGAVSLEWMDATKALNLVRSLWPWKSPVGFNRHLMSPRTQTDMVNWYVKRLMAEPETLTRNEKGQWVDETGALSRFMRGIGVNWGAPELKYGFIAQKLMRAMNAWLSDTKAAYAQLFGKGGHLTELTDVQNRDAFRAAGMPEAEWAKHKFDEPTKTAARWMRTELDRYIKDLVETSPVTYWHRQKVELLKTQIERAKQSAETATGSGKGLAERNLRDLQKEMTDEMIAIENFRGAITMDNFVHHVSSEDPVTFGDYTILQKRTGALKKSGKLLEDARASMTDYVAKAIRNIHRNRALGEVAEFLHGKQRAIEWSDVADPNRRMVFSYGDRSNMAMVGEVYVTESNGRRRISPTREYTIETKEDGTTERVWHDVEKPEGARRMVALADGSMRTGLADLAYRPELNFRVLNDKLSQREQNAVELLHPNDAMLRVSVTDGGWLGRASKEAKGGMEAYVTKFATGMNEMRIGQKKAEGILAAVGRFSSKMKMIGISTPTNMLLQGTFMNSMFMGINDLHFATKQSATYMHRRFLGRGRNVEIAAGAEFGSPEFMKGREIMRSTPEELAKMKPADAARQVYADEAFSVLPYHPIFENMVVDMARSMRLPKDIHKQPTVEQLQKELKWKPMDYALSGVRGADAYVRLQNYLGVFVPAREAGHSIKKADEIATASVVFNQGMFNTMTEHPLLSSWVGQFQLGLHTYVARQMFVMASAPREYQFRYAAMMLTMNYVWDQLGLGDLTSALGTNFYDTYGGDLVAQYMLGDQNPEHSGIVRRGTFPFPLAFGSSPMITASKKLFGAAMALGKGDTSQAGQLAIRAGADAFMPPLVDTISRFNAPKTESGDYNVIPVATKMSGAERTSYTLKQNGVMQLLKELVPGTQQEVALHGENMRIQEAQAERLKGQRADIGARIRAVVRRLDEGAATGTMTEAQRADENKRFAKIAEDARHLGINLADPDVRRRYIAEARERIQLDKLPGELRQITAPGMSKEGQVRALIGAVKRGISKERLLTLRQAVAPQVGLMTWATDPESVSPETATEFRKAMAAYSGR